MSTMFSAPATAQDTTGHTWAGRMAAAFSQLWVDCMTRRLESAWINQLWSMSDRDLRDMGLSRSEITPAVKGDSTRNRAVRRGS